VATFSYENSVPNANNAPKNDQPDMLQNTQSISGLIAVDHIGFNIPNGGYHKIIHQMGSGTSSQSQNLTRSGVGAVYANKPTNIADINQFLSGQYTPDSTVTATDTQLFSLTGGNVISQLTGSNLTDTATSDGYAWVGGILLQWGFVSSTSQTATSTVTFKDRQPGMIPFPNNCFLVNATLVVKNTATMSNIRTAQLVIYGPSVSKTGFNWAYNYETSGISQGFYWFAVGN